MSSVATLRPAADEFAPYYAPYIARVEDSDVLAALESQMKDFEALLSGVDDTRAAHRYAPGKWSIKQVIGHLIDGERVFTYRALRFARADQTELPGFEENDYAEAAGSDARSLDDLMDELRLVRRSTIAMFRGLQGDAWQRRGVANGVPVSVRAIAFIIAGHGRHHAAMLKERYLAG